MHSEPKIYETFDHTADLGIKVTAKNITGLFFNSAQTLNDLLVDDVPVVAKSDEQIEINAPDQEMLLHDFLAELLSLFWSDNQLITKIKILELTNTH
ncbi:MAG: archease, partial [Candidatus Marinimicrobia bacterium]|nr:archease [Candidatus Neomarinimicrobiota bacterium]